MNHKSNPQAELV